MVTTWQKMLAITIGIAFGLIVGYICIKPHLENSSIPETQNTYSNDVFNQYLKNNQVNTTNTNTTYEN